MTGIRSLPDVTAPVASHPRLRRKAMAVVAVLKPNATPERVAALTRNQWVELGRKAGIDPPSPLVQALVVETVREMREVIDGGD